MTIAGGSVPRVERRTLLVFGGYAVAFAVVALGQLAGLDPTVRFVLAILALAGGAVAVGESTERLSERLSPASTGVVQSVLGNLPELFLSIFALRAGLAGVVAAALIGSVLGNALFVLGLALLVGGARHGRLFFSKATNRLYATELLLGVSALVIGFLATRPSEPDAGHDVELSAIVAVVLLVIFAISVPISNRLAEAPPGARYPDEADGADARDGAAVAVPARHALAPTLVLLAISAGSAAFVADWFVDALRPAMAAIGMSEAFAGLIVVALAGNAVENLAGVRAAYRRKGDLALSLILNSALQVVLFLVPVVVLLSHVVAPAPLPLVFDPLLLGTMAVTAILVFAIVLDGEANALEGAMLLGLYVIVAAGVWWGPVVRA